MYIYIRVRLKSLQQHLMGKTVGSRKKATQSKSINKISVLKAQDEQDGALEEVKGVGNQQDESVDVPSSKRLKKTSSKSSSKKIVIIEQDEEPSLKMDEFQEDAVQDVASAEPLLLLPKPDNISKDEDMMENEINELDNAVSSVSAPLSPKSTLLAFRRDPALQNQKPLDEIVIENQTASARQNTLAPAAEISVIEPARPLVASVTNAVPESLPHPIARDTIEFYKQAMAATAKENESLKSLLAQVQTCLKQSEDGFVQYKQLHELKVSELTKSVEMLSAERASFTIALQGDESQDGESGGVSLAHYRSLVSQMEVMKQHGIERESELQTTKQTLSLFQKQCSDLNSQLETLSLKAEEVKQERDTALDTVEQLTAQLAEQTALVSEKTADANKFKEAFEKARSENGRLQTLAVQTQSQLAAIEAKKTSLETQEKLANELKAEIIFTATLEKMLDVIKKLTGISVQNAETVMRPDMDTMEQNEYTQFTIKQKGDAKSISYLLCVPTNKALNMIYIPTTKGHLPAWLSDEMEFQNHMIRLFFCNTLAYCNNDANSQGEGDLVGMMA